MDSLGLSGTVVGDLSTSYETQVLTTVITNISNGASGMAVFQGVGDINPATIIFTYIGERLAQALWVPDSMLGQIGASIGSSVGALVFLPAGPLGLIAAVVAGYLIGGLLGTMLNGGGKPKSWDTVDWDAASGKFVAGSPRSVRGASKDVAAYMANTVVGGLNYVIEKTGARLIDPRQVRTGEYGMRGKDYVYWTQDLRTGSMDEAMNRGIAVALSDMVHQLLGGDVIEKRALVGSLGAISATPVTAANFSLTSNFNFSQVSADLSVGEDYAKYLLNKTAIDASIADDVNSAFAAGWMITLARARELGLGKRAYTDWIGGWAALLDEADDGLINGEGFSAANLDLSYDYTLGRKFNFYEGNLDPYGSLDDSILNADKDHIVATAGNDAITVNADTVANTSGLTIDGGTPAGSTFTIGIAAAVDAGDGNDTVRMGDLGNDVLGGNGNDIIVGGKLDDWIFGDAGNDILFAGNVSNISFGTTSGAADLAALNAALTVDGGNGDYLSGGDGDDRLYGSKGSDWLSGGDGNDLLYGGAGGDVIQLGVGNDQGAAGAAAGFGGGGSDQYIFGYGDGADIVLDDDGSGVSVNLNARVNSIAAGTTAKNWAGNGDYTVDGSARGGEDAISFGVGVTIADIVLSRPAGTNDLVIQLTSLVNPSDPASRAFTGDSLTIKNWFLDANKIEWLRFADGEELRVGDIANFVIGTAATDVIIGSYASDFLYGGDGNDTMYGLSGNDFGNGGAGDDFISGDGDNDFVLGGSGADMVMGGAGNDDVLGDEGNDYVSGDDGADVVSGGRGNDTVITGAGNDVIVYDRGDGSDTVMDELNDNWEIVTVGDVYQNGYTTAANGTVTKGGVVYNDGAHWIGTYRYDAATRTLKRYLGADASGAVTSNAGNDVIQFSPDIDIQDLVFQKSGQDLLIAVGSSDNDTRLFQSMGDQMRLVDYYRNKNIESLTFAATGLQAIGAGGANLVGGTDGADTLGNTTGVDWITGGAGADSLDGGAGDDIVSGGAGMDTVRGGIGADILYGGADADLLIGGAGADKMFGGDGQDVASYIDAATGVVASLATGSGTGGDAVGDTFDGIEGLEGSNFSDSLTGDSNANMLRGLGGNDTLKGGLGDDTYEILPGNGADTIDETVGSDGLDTIAFGGGLGFANLSFTRNGNGSLLIGYGTSQSVTILGQTTAVSQIENLELDSGVIAKLSSLRLGADLSTSDVDFVVGSAGVDSLNGLGGDDVIYTGLGNDLASGGDGNDWVEGGSGNSLIANAGGLYGGVGNDVIIGGGGSDDYMGEDGDDLLIAQASSGNSYDGGNGQDNLSYERYGAAVSVDLTTATDASGWRVVASGKAKNVENLTGSISNDTLIGDGGDNVLTGLAGADSIRGNGGIDKLVGGDGNDTLVGDAGNDQLVGGADNDSLSGGSEDDVLSGDDGDDILSGGTGNDTLVGGAGADNLTGDDGNDLIHGGIGNDNLAGAIGDDIYDFDVNDDQDTVIDVSGTNRISLTNVTSHQVWLVKNGSDLKVGVIGGTTFVTIKNFYAPTGGTLIKSIATGSETIFLKYAQPLIDAMTAASSMVPTSIPQAIVDMLPGFWHDGSTAAPELSDVRVSTSEDASVSGLINATDQDEDLSISSAIVLTDGAFGHATLNGSGGWTYTPNGNASGLDGFVVKVTDAAGHMAYKTVGVQIDAVNDAPVAAAVTNGTLLVNEKAANGTGIVTFTGTDVDGDALTYSLTNSAGGRFAIDPVTGQLSVANGSLINYAAATSHNITVRVADPSGLYADQTFTVQVHETNVAPDAITLTGGAQTIAENTATNTNVARFTGHDVDGDVLTYSLFDNAGGRFAINATTGQVTVANSALLNYEANTSHNITVRGKRRPAQLRQGVHHRGDQCQRSAHRDQRHPDSGRECRHGHGGGDGYRHRSRRRQRADL